jgi:hypothetical protein
VLRVFRTGPREGEGEREGERESERAREWEGKTGVEIRIRI